MILTDVTTTRLQVVDHGRSVILHIGGDQVLLSTSTEARALLADVGRALVYLDEVERADATRRDVDAAREVNAQHLQANLRDGTLPQVYPAITTGPAPVVFDNCACTRVYTCLEHRSLA